MGGDDLMQRKMAQVPEGATLLLVLDLLRGLDDHLFIEPIEERPRAAGIGPHLRHCLEFYQCFLRDFDRGRIDYDHRDRTTEFETDRLSAIRAIEQIMAAMTDLGEIESDRRIEVRHDPAPTEDVDTCWHPSTVGRELRFLTSHTVHHYALIALILRSHGFDPGEEFGVAPATLAFWDSESQTVGSGQSS